MEQTDVVQTTTPTPVQGTVNPTVVPETTPKTEQEIAQEAVSSLEHNSYESQGNSIKHWIANDYDYDATQAGTLWVAGKINSPETQIKFLEATLNEDLYDELDLHKYYFDTNLATARAYANEKKHEIAYTYYRAAEEKALAEAQLTGWYLPAEGQYLLNQWVVAEEKLKDPNLSQTDRDRASAVKRAASGWFEANSISTRGVECLNSLYLKETIRHNKENERLQEQANEIQRKANEDAANAASSSYSIQLRTHRYQTGEMELDMGIDIDKNGVIGHSGEFAKHGFYNSQKDWAKANLGEALKLWGSDYTKFVMGNDFQIAHNEYLQDVQDSVWLETQYNTGTGFIDGGNIDKLTDSPIKNSELSKIIDTPSLIKDATIKVIRTQDGKGAQLWVFDKNGSGYQITDEKIKLANGKTIGEVLSKQGLTLDTSSKPYLTFRNDKGEDVNLYIGKRNFGEMPGSVTTSKNVVKDLPKGVENNLEAEEKQGRKMANGIISVEKSNTAWVSVEMDAEGNKIYREVNKDGTKAVNKSSNILDVHINADGTYDIKHADGSELTTWQKGNITNYGYLALSQAEEVGSITTESGAKEKIYAYTNSDGSVVFLSIKTISEGYLKDTTEHIITTYSPEELKKNSNFTLANGVTSLKQYAENKEDYVNGVDIKSVSTDTASGVAEKEIAKTTEEEKKSIETSMTSSVKTSDTKPREITKSETSKPSKTSSEQVLESIKDEDPELAKYVTAFAEGEVLKQQEDISEEMKKQLGNAYKEV